MKLTKGEIDLKIFPLLNVYYRESIEVLRARNIQLRNELKLLNEQLNIHLAKKKPFKSDVHGSPGRNSPAQNTPANQGNPFACVNNFSTF